MEQERELGIRHHSSLHSSKDLHAEKCGSKLSRDK
ncbi:hypothetical protein TNIN_123511, partial [Trichonephila inaurata madagascariensis]